MTVAWCGLLGFGIVATLIGLKSFFEVRTAADASEVFAFVMQAVAIAGFGVLLSGGSLQHLADLWGVDWPQFILIAHAGKGAL